MKKLWKRWFVFIKSMAVGLNQEIGGLPIKDAGLHSRQFVTDRYAGRDY